MIAPITIVRFGERSAAVANLHTAMKLAGFDVAQAEVDDQRAGETTVALIHELQRRAGVRPKEGYLVDDATAEAINTMLRQKGILMPEKGASCWVRGRLRMLTGPLPRDLTVTAYDQDLRKRQSLGRSRTRVDGEYVIFYASAQFRNADSSGPDLVLEVSTAREQVLFTSAVIFNAPLAYNLDIEIATRPAEAEYDAILHLVEPLLAGQDATLDALDENEKLRDVTFIAGETGIARERLMEFVVAQRLASKTLPAQFWYAATRSGAIGFPLPPADGWPSLADTARSTLEKARFAAPATVRAGLKRAVDQGVIEATEGTLSAWMHHISSEDTAKAGNVPPLHSKAAIRELLGSARLPDDRLQLVLAAFAEEDGHDEAIARLRKDGALDDAQLNDVSTRLALHEVTLGDVRLAGALLSSQAIDLEKPGSLQRLARLDKAGWEQTMRRGKVQAPDFLKGDNTDEKLGNYAKLMELRFRRAHPTAAFAGDLARDLERTDVAARVDAKSAEAERIVNQRKQSSGLLQFLDRNPGFALDSTGIDRFLKEKASPETAELVRDPEFVTNLKATQRIYKIAPTYEATRALRNDGLHSAQQVYRMGKSEFVRKYAGAPGLDEKVAGEIFERAANTHAAAVTIVAELKATADAGDVLALNSGSDAVSEFPNLSNLFGSADACDCEQCRSVFGPAAYLADILMYLEGRNAADGITPVKSVLFDRRPDIGGIELTCSNANTTLPYVDLVCEVLEDRVAPWKLFDLPAALSPNFVKGPVNAAVRNAFAAAVMPVTLTAKARLSEPDDLGDWVIRDTDVNRDHTWRVHPAGAALEVSVLRQTRGTPEELAANSEYVNDAAYVKLAGAYYPMALPFDLATEEVDAYLAKISVKRSAIMETFRGPVAPNNSTDLDIAAAHIGVSPAERSLIFTADPGHQFGYWGEATNAAASAALSHVDTFLNRTGLTYQELQTLLTLGFVNPGGTVRIQPLDTSCDLATRRIQPLDENVLDRIHRFMRLWRKLGWKMWEVDLVVRNAQIGNGTLNNAFLLQLYAFVQVRQKLGRLTIEQACALFDRINTRSKFTGDDSKPEPSLYEQLFLNKRVMDKLDPAFAIDAVTAADVPVPPAGVPDISPGHLSPLIAATRASEADLEPILGLIRPVGDPAGPSYIDGKLHLGNLSFVYRHALVTRTLRIKPKDWAHLLYILQKDVFAAPSVLLEFLKLNERIKAAGFSTDELGYVLAADLTGKSIEADKAIAGTLTTLRKSLQLVATAAATTVPTDVDGRIAFMSAQLLALGWSAASVTALAALLQPEARAAAIPETFVFPTAITDVIPIAFSGDTRALRFRGLMTAAQRTTLLTDGSLAAVTAIPDYQTAIQALFNAPRDAMKFYWPEFRTSLKSLPADVQFGAQLPPDVAAKVRYDSERRELVFFGVMTPSEQADLKGASANAAYLSAVSDLFNQPTGAVGADRLWVGPADDLASAATKLMAYGAATASRNLVIQQLAQALKITPAVSEHLLSSATLFGMPKHPLLADFLANAFIASSAAITAAAFPDLFGGYRWLHRVALVLRKSRATFADLQWLRRTAAQTGVLDFLTLPLVYDATVPALASLAGLLDLCRFLELHHAFSTADLSLLDVIDRVTSDGTYVNTLFAADLETLVSWPHADIEALTAASALNLAFPADYAHVAAWDRLVRAFDLLMRLHGAAPNAFSLGGPAVSPAIAQTLKQLLRGKYEVEQWLDISKSVQDGLRHRKRDSLVAWLLTQPRPADAPSPKWENANDLYAYYLIDVEMGACMQTSRIVQASNAVQLFVQRCFMGIEPKVRVSVEFDEAWNQWPWMKGYRLWEANRRVFVHPENYALPELKRDKSELFRKLEDELLQNELTRDNVETAFLHYLDKLDEIAQLEIAGTYYQENTRTLHVFGRTPGSEPHIYYYRQFIDSRRWTAWSKVECDIKSQYLVPLVANERLHLVWPEFREIPSDQGAVNIPNQGDTSVSLAKPSKKMSVYLAVTELRSGKWLPKKVTQDPVIAEVSYTEELDQSPYVILPLDFTWMPDGPFLLLVYRVGASSSATLFELAGCKGYPEPYEGKYLTITPVLTRFDRDRISYIKNIEADDGDRLMPRDSYALTRQILDMTPGLFKVSYPQYLSQFDRLFFVIAAAALGASGYGTRAVKREGRGFYATLGTFYDWFYADKLRTFFVQHEVMAPNGTRSFYQDFIASAQELLWLFATGQHSQFFQYLIWFVGSGYKYELLFNNFYHPLTCFLTKQLYAKGLSGLLSRETQFQDKKLDFKGIYQPTDYVDPQYPQEIVDFTSGASYSQYNWELFYFAPLMIAMRLSSNQKFEEAMRWFHYIFDPTGGHDKDPVSGAPVSAPQKYWITQPFFLRQAPDYDAQRIETLMNMLAANVGAGTPPPEVKALQDHIADWRKNPFDPHIVAQFRTVAYQKLTVMKYIDNLVAWGDQQFRLFTMESVNLATQLYVLAAEILGRRPRKVPPPEKSAPETFNEIEDKLDKFSNAMVELENFVPALPPSGGGGPPAPTVPTLLYFCIPQNEQLIGYFDRVEDRLYKLRHCLDIDGVPRSLALFAPPIDPMALIRAMAAGADLAGAIAGLDAPLPHYRFVSTLQKANEFNSDVKALGAALLGALEKKDAEALSRLRQQHELAVLNAARIVKQAQIEEATRGLEGLQKTREMVTIRRDYYASRPFVNPGETAALSLNTASLIVHAAGAVADVLGGVLAAIPDFQLGASGFGGSPHASAKTGGQSFSKAAELAARALYQTSTIMDKSASISSTLAGYQRRMDDWQHQLALASKELEQTDRQIAGAQIRVDNAQRELDNHDLQIENSKAIDAFFHDKYTNQELYEWMTTQVSQTYFQSYQLAFDLARRAERCFQFELGVDSSSYIQFGYWDSLKSGLQAGERLQLALRQLESAYLEANRREFECTKHISLALVNPMALVALKDTGRCVVDVPEELFDLDYPGHYFRRIKSVSISLPAVAGPHTTVSCTLRLLRSMVRADASLNPQYEHNNDNGVLTDDTRFRESHVRVNAIATSNAQNDSGMFELNFRDERYLPFEGAGAVSTWQIELVADRELRQFDYDTISDVILHMRYTAREDAGQFKDDAIAHLKSAIQNVTPSLRLRRMFDLRREFATEWYSFLHPAPGGHKTLSIQLTRDHFPALWQEGVIQVEAISVATQTISSDEMKVQVHPPLGDQIADQLTLAAPTQARGFRAVTKKNIGDLLDSTTPWEMRLRKTALTFDDLDPDDIKECFLVVEYTLQPA